MIRSSSVVSGGMANVIRNVNGIMVAGHAHDLLPGYPVGDGRKFSSPAEALGMEGVSRKNKTQARRNFIYRLG